MCHNKRRGASRHACNAAAPPVTAGDFGRTTTQQPTSPPVYSQLDFSERSALGHGVPQLERDIKARLHIDTTDVPATSERGQVPTYDQLYPDGTTKVEATASHQVRPSDSISAHLRQIVSNFLARRNWDTTPARDGAAQPTISGTNQQILQADVAAFDDALVSVRAGKCCSRCQAKRAVKQLRRDLIRVGLSQAGGRLLGCHERKMLKRDAKEVAREYKRAVRDTWRMARRC